MEFIKNYKNKIIELIIIFTITFLFNLICNPLTSDEIWNYGFAYNIANGLLPYKDFNLVVTPLFPFIGALFLVIFGKNLIVYHLFNAVICTLIFYFMKKCTNRGYYILYSILLLFSLPNYSLFSLLLLYIIIYLEENNKNDLLIGIFIGLMFLTKQNIGIVFIIPILLTKNLKKIKTRIIGFFIPNIILLIFLIFTKSLFYFIDYTFLGLTSFANENTVFSIWGILNIIAIIYLILEYKNKKTIIAIYLLCFQVLAYPIFDTYHVIIPFIPVLGYFLSHLNLVVKMTKISFCVFIGILFIYNIQNLINNNIKFPNDTFAFKLRPLNNYSLYYINEVSNYIKNTNNVYIINANAYLYKLESNIPITKFDLLNDGNLGKDGDIKIIEELKDRCKKNDCTFLMLEAEINNTQLSQTNQKIIKYVDENYDKCGKLLTLTIYKNEVK